MKYTYFPGCSLLNTAKEYDVSARAVMRELDSELVEIPDWNCCGATAADVVSYLLSISLPARNLAMAEGMGQEVVATCSSCFLNLYRVNKHLEQDPELKGQLDIVLAEAGLSYSGNLRVRHLLDVIANDIGVKAVAKRAERRFAGIKVAPYYGCQVVRPYAEFDGPDLPMSMDRLIAALGAETIPYPVKTRCCGGVLMTTQKSIGVKLVADILEPAKEADCVVTVCPLCQLNLEAYQREVAGKLGWPVRLPILYFTQFIGLAFGLPERDLQLSSHLVSAEKLMMPRSFTSKEAGR
ncbi:MAG: CoB--CoM heterodisulfide reductase iron-sulfur subunit B family protein [Chloroflexota bacterium]